MAEGTVLGLPQIFTMKIRCSDITSGFVTAMINHEGKCTPFACLHLVLKQIIAVMHYYSKPSGVVNTDTKMLTLRTF